MRMVAKVLALMTCTGLLVASAPAMAAPPTEPQTKPADAPNTEEARTRYNRGIELYNDGDYKLALIEFQRSYDLAPNWRILYNLGEVHYQLNNYAAALQALEKYLADGGNEIPGKRRAEVDKDIDALKARTGFLTIATNVAGADVTVDDVALGKTPLAPDTLVDAGTRKVVVSKAGYATETKTVTLAGKDHQSVSIQLTEETKPIATSPPTEHANYVWVGWAASGALAAGATVTGILALNANSDLKDLRNTKDVTRSQLDSQDTKRATLSLASDILAAATIVGVGVSTYFTIKGPGKESSPTSPTVRASLGPGSAALSGRF